MLEKVFPMTLEGKDKLEQELEELKTIKRKEFVERIKIARSFGDLSVNSEYESAK
ncbi:transcription elongation factor GreA, partial [Enterococcus faecalis]